MKNHIKQCATALCRIGTLSLLLCSPGWLSAQPAVGSAVFSGPPDDIGPNHRLWTVPGAQNPTVELASGMNFWDGQGWRQSEPSFTLANNAFVANRVQQSLSLSSDLNVMGAVSMKIPGLDGPVLNSTPLAIGLYDARSGQFAVIASLTNCAGALVSSNCVVYENAFVADPAGPGVCASVVYTLEQGSLAQDVVFTGRLNPADFGFPPDTTRIQIITELYAPPAPDVLTRPVYVEKDPTVRSQMASPDLMDETIGFGGFVLSAGRAYTPPTDAEPAGTSAFVAKEFRTVGSRTILIESVPYMGIAKGLLSLPECGSSGAAGQAKLKGTTNLKAAYAALPVPGRARQANAVGSRAVPVLAKAAQRPHGVVIDYIGTINSGYSHLTVFQSFTNYFISGTVYMLFSATIEGGTVFKYKAGASISFGTVTCNGSQFRPIIFTAVDDDSVGDTLNGWPNSGYTGTINTNGYANPAMYLSGNASLSNCFFRYAQIAVANSAVPYNGTFTLAHAQFLNCIQGINLTGATTAANATVSVNNALMANVKYPFSMNQMGGSAWTMANCTLDQSTQMAVGDGGAGLQSYNSVYANVSSMTGVSGGQHNGFYNSSPFGSSSITSSVWPFQMVGTARHYLTNGCGFQGTGGTNGLSASLLSDLQLRTTYPPTVILPATINTNLTLLPWTQRDNTNATAKDLGYHYDPIDWALSSLLVTNATVSLTSPGTVLAIFGTNGGNYGLGIGQGGQLLSQGSPTSPNWIVQFNAVQEQLATDTNWWRTTNGLVISEFQGASQGSVINARFTDWSVLSLDAPCFNAPTNSGPLNFQDCEFHGGRLLSYGPTLNLTNCLLERVYTDIRPKDGQVSYYRNNTVYGGIFSVALTNSVIEANIFDRPWITNYIGAWGNSYTGHFNAYITTNYGVLAPTNATDDVLALASAPAYASGPLGSYYLPSTSGLINYDTNTTADLVGLYHYTVVTNMSGGYGIKETNSFLDLGHHYVALSTNGLPIDTNGDGIPDYLSDANGNGIVDSGEIGWNIVGDLGLKVLITRPKNNSIIP